MSADTSIDLDTGSYWGVDADEWRDQEDFADSQAICRRVVSARPPAADLPDAKAAAALAECSSVDLYYGLGGHADAEKARHCAYVELAKARAEGYGLGMSGAGVLTMIYANGDGVERNLEVATRFACSISAAAPAELDGRAKHLAALSGKPTERLDYCDDVTSGWAGGECAYVDSRRMADKRAARLKALTAGWTSDQLATLATLRTTEEAFAESRANTEFDLSGTMWRVFQLGARSEVFESTVERIEALEKGPLTRDVELGAAERRLNEVYRRTIGSNDFTDNDGYLTSEGLRKTERLWISYRDAFVSLARLRWPQSQDALSAALAVERTQQLHCLTADFEGYDC